MTYLALLVGGAVGGILRYALGFVPGGGQFPSATLFINLVGSLLLGALYAVTAFRKVPVPIRIGLATGVLGAFTTFSTFCLQTSRLALAHLPLAVLYALVSAVGGPLFALFGNQAVQAVLRRREQPAKEVST